MKRIEKTTQPPGGKPPYNEWVKYIAEQSRNRKGIESVRTRRQYD